MSIAQAIQKLLLTVGCGLIAAALILGLTPMTVGNTSYDGDGFKCGSAFFVSDDLTDLGHETCEVVGGRGSDRAWAFGLLVMGVILLIGAVTTDVSGASTGQATRPTFTPPTF